jgi:hypothetical protein
MVMPCSSRSQETTQEQQKQSPKPIEAHKLAQQGVRLTATLGLVIETSKYSYSTTVVTQNGSALNYSGTHRSPGATPYAGAAITPPGALRRLTLGVDLHVGGLDLWGNSVTAGGSSGEQSKLNSLIAQQSFIRPPWRSFITPYIEHDLGSLLENKLRLGYQRWQAAGSYQGSVAANLLGSANVRYNVRLSQSTHLIRLSVNNDVWSDVTETNHPPPKRRFGLVRQGGVLIGTDGTIAAFVTIGPVWIF